MPCHTYTAGVEPTITQVEYHCKQRNEIILFLFRYRQAEAQDAHAALARDRSMRCERRGFLLDRGLLGHGRCSGRGLVPLDRLRLARHRAREHLVHARDRNNLEAFLDALADLHEVLGVLFGNEHCFDAPAQGREQLLLETGDRPHAATQRDFPGHGDVAAHRNAGHHRDDRGGHGDTGRGAVLRGCAFRDVHVDVPVVKQGRLDAEGDRAHANVRRRRRDRFLHHIAQVAGHRHPTLARHHGGFDGEQLAADVGPREPGHYAHLVLVLDFAGTWARRDNPRGYRLRPPPTSYPT